MSQLQSTRAERMAQYKEERRKQLASQFAPLSEPQTSVKKRVVHKEISSSSEEPRTTRASRLRAAASVQEEKTIPHSSNGTDAQRSTRLERDKSSKRKSNLNRALNSEEIPQPDSTDDLVNRRRRRRFFPPEILHQPSKESSLSDNVSTASYVTNTAISTTRIPLKKSELSIHMENARKGQLVSYSDMGKSNRVSPKKTVDPVKPNLDKSDKSNLANKENRTLVKTEKSVEQTAGKLRRSLNVSKRMDELTALTQDTLARVERLAIKTRDTNKVGTSKKIPPKVEKLSKIERDQAQKHSILKKKEEPVAPSSSVTVVSGPVSILKRKISLDDYRSQSGTPSTSTPPVTFSPNVVDPATNRRRQGILKKRRSLDESQVLRHRSCSPEVAARFRSDSRSILKNQRRSSLEEILRTQSPESGLHSILKRRSSRVDDELDPPINSPEPHGILKRRSGSSSAGSNTHTPHVSIATAVILAAAGGAEMVLESNEQVKPILKKRSFSEEQGVDVSTFEVPKPILKKKSSTDTDDCEEKPKKPILKNSKNSIEDRDSDVSESSHHSYRFSYQRLGDDVTECEVKPILKQSTSRENSPRPRLSFCSNDLSSDADSSEFRHRRSSRRSHTVCTDFNVKNVLPPCKVEDRELSKPRPLSVCDMVLNIEKRLSTGAIPKTSHGKRHGERYRTQPVTYHELEASRNSLQKSLYQDLPQPTSVLSNSDSNNQNAHSLLDLTTSFDSDHNLNSFLSSSLPNTTFDSGISGKMSSDSAFQSLGDGLELENENLSSPSPVEEKCVPAKLQMKALAEEAKNLQLKRGVGGFKPKSRHSEDSRFLTRSTVIEQEAKRVTVNEDSAVDFKLDRTDPARLSISDRIKLFSDTISCNATKYRSRSTRFQSQPVTVQEVESARGPSRKHNMFALDSSKDENVSQKERKGILKSKLDFTHVSSRISPNFQESLKSVLKKSEEVRREGQTSSSLRSILKPESSDCALDEGISSDESQSGSEFDNSARNSSDKHVSLDSARILTVNEKLGCKKLYDNGKTSSDDTNQTSDGDSSGGREVRSIIEGGDWLARKRHRERVSNEGFLYKSKSQGVIRDEEEIKTPGIRRSLTNATMPQKIAELQAKLQQSGDNEWRKRIPKLNNANEELSLLNVKNIYNDELTDRRTILAARKDQLDAASKQWRNRVEQSDAVNFSVAGRMQLDNDVPTIPINIPSSIKTKRTPKAKTFKGKESGDINTDSSSLPSSPEKNGSVGVKRSTSLPGSGDTGRGVQDSLVTSSRKVKVERPDNITFTSFFESIHSKSKSDVADITVGDFDIVSRQSSNLLVQKRTVRVQRRREATKNPIKALAARLDIADEYTEVTTGLAEKEKQRLNIEKIAKSSNFAVEALAGLASKEDFNSVALKRSSSLNSTYPPFNELMLLQIKGRRFVQTRLVEPIASSINEGDCYILVTYNAVYNYIGAYANVIEQSRAADIVNSIQQKVTLVVNVIKLLQLIRKKIASCGLSEIEKFWKLLGAPAQEVIVAKAGHPDEDEIYETSILGTNMIYEYQNDELVPVENYWGTMPKIEMLSPMKTFVFDFGSEMYVWSGKNALLEDKKKALKLARELWNEGYNYTECGINPLKVSLILGSREHKVEVLTDTIRPKWALFAKLTQHRETVLFKEKFLDWPDYGRVIKVRQNSNDNNVEVKFDFKPCSIEELCKNSYIEPDLVTDGMHLGRGLSFYDEETNRMFNFTTRSVTCWVILEYTHEKLPSKSIGQFFDGNSYIVRWEYCANTTGRGLSGQPSKHVQSGRDLCVYFCWQGSNATINEKGAAALLTIQLDSENARQIRVLQGSEPPVFLNLFKGDMVIHSGKHENPSVENHRLYICRGEIETETFLTEVPCSMRSLRSRASYVLVSCKSGEVTIWNGCKSSSQTRLVTLQVAERIIENELSEFGFSSDCDELSVVAVEEGSETKEFMQAVGGEKRQLYMSLLKKNEDFDYTPKLFHLTSISGKFEAREQMCPHRSNHITPYPHWQNDLYSVSQPALFMLDNKYEVWLWQGWWPELENDSVLMDQTGSGAIRWQEERKAAMQTVVDYCKRDSESKHVPAYLVWAGLEPLAFTNLFPFWSDRDEVTELNMQDGKKPGEAIVIEKELALLTRSTYPLDQLLQRPLPDGVDPTHLENYLSPDDFSELMSMTLEEFQKLPTWKQTSVKKEKGLF